MIATLSLWCGTMLLVLDSFATNVSGNQGQVALIGLVFGSNRRQLFMG